VTYFYASVANNKWQKHFVFQFSNVHLPLSVVCPLTPIVSDYVLSNGGMILALQGHSHTMWITEIEK